MAFPSHAPLASFLPLDYTLRVLSHSTCTAVCLLTDPDVLDDPP
jgi:hypothetical protein